MATPRRPEPPNKSGFLGVFILVGIMGGLAWLAMLIFGWGPYQPEEPEKMPTVTATEDRLIALISTPSPSRTPTANPTMTLTQTSTPTNTQVPTETPTPTLELRPFILSGEPEAINDAMIPPTLGCDWLVIAGQVWDLQDAPVTGLTLHLFGELDVYIIDRFTLSGFAEAYGESGYEFRLENLVVDSEESLFIQLVDTNGLPLSHPYPIQTYADCQKNLILVNFKQVR